ncbi:UNVERIFIED_CONTAM: type IV pilus assembly protein PilA [Acetivibrio alkalicellulosi]
MRKIIKNKKGFSLIELLIVIAIIGVISIMAFAAFTGILESSRRKSDHQTAHLIEKAIEVYIISTNDIKLGNLSYDEIIDKDMDTEFSTELILALQHKITCELNGEELAPLLVPKEGSTPSADNFSTISKFYKGFRIEIYPDLMKSNVIPVSDIDQAVVNVNG